MELYVSPYFLALHSLFFVISLVGFMILSFIQKRKLRQTIAEQNRILEKLRDSETLLQHIFDSVPVGISLLDEQGNIMDCNQASEQLLGLSKDEHTVRQADSEEWLIYDTEGNILKPESYASVRALRQKQAVLGQEMEVCKPHDQNVWISVNAVPFYHSQYALLVSYYDITPQKQAEKDRINHQKFLSTLIQTLPDLMWFKNPEGVYLQCNQRFEAFFGKTEAEIIGKTDYDFVSKKQADEFRHHDIKAIQSQYPVTNMERVTFASDGHEELLETTKTAVYNHQGELTGVLGIGHDVTPFYSIKEALELAISSYEELFSSVMEAVIIESDAGRILSLNKSATHLLGRTEEWLINTAIEDLAANENAVRTLRDYRTRAQKGTSQIYTCWIQHANGNVFPAEIHQTSGLWFGQQAIFTIMIDISERLSHQRELEHIAHYDSLTHLPNRILLSDRILQALAQSERSETLVGIVFLDLDGFKKVNDTHGHATGDRLLIELSLRLKETLRKGDTLARLGGDEFVAVILNLKNSRAIEPILQRLLEAASTPFQIKTIEAHVSASIGVTFFPQKSSPDVDQLLRQADQAMYQAKQAGKNRYHFFDPIEEQGIRQQHQESQRLEQAFAQQEFCLYYQPKVNMNTGKVLGAEALIRWQHPEHGILAPIHFLPKITDPALNLSLGKWVLESAVKQLATWQAQGLNFSISVNIDSDHLQAPDFVANMKKLLNKYPTITAAQIELEILETHLIEDLKSTSQIIRECQQLGIRFALDDFGTGYSSLSYLKALPVNTLKIDQSFIRDMLETPEDLSILENTLELARVFEKTVIIEGVETLAHGQILLQMGCIWGQGYSIGRPMATEDFEHWRQVWKLPTLWKTTKTLPKDLRPILIAIADHKARVRSLVQYLESDTREQNLDFMDKPCRLEHWLYHYQETRPIKNDLFEIIINFHDAFHEKAQKVISKRNTLSASEAQYQKDFLQELSREIEVLLQKWLTPDTAFEISKTL